MLCNFSVRFTVYKQLLDEVEHDIMSYQNRGLCYLPKPKAEADNIDIAFIMSSSQAILNWLNTLDQSDFSYWVWCIITLFVLQFWELWLSLNCTKHHGRHGSLTVSVLVSGLTSPGLSLGQGHCIVFLDKTLYSQSASLRPGVYSKWVPANLMLGLQPCNGLASHLGGA